MEIILLVLIVLVFIGLPVLQMKKQSKQVGEIRNFQSSLVPGMVVQLTSGLHGRISSVGEGTVDIEVSPGVVTTWDRGAVLKLVDTVEPGTAEAGHLTGARDTDGAAVDGSGVPDDLSSLGSYGPVDRESDHGAGRGDVDGGTDEDDNRR